MFKEQDFSITKSTIVYDHYIKVKQDIVNTPNGTIVDYNYIYSNTNAVLVLPIHDNKIIMLKQYRYPLKKYVYDLPGGGTKVGDTTLETAKKELKEETGYDVELIKEIAVLHEEAISAVKHVFSADIAGGEILQKNDEILDVKWLTFDEIKTINDNDKIRRPWVWDIIQKDYKGTL